jgi:hypothetical protein
MHPNIMRGNFLEKKEKPEGKPMKAKIPAYMQSLN